MAPNTNDAVVAAPWTETRDQDDQGGVRLSASVLLHLKLTRLGLCSNRPSAAAAGGGRHVTTTGITARRNG